MCEEYRGPLKKYKDLGVEQLHLPTTDHFEPTVEDLMVCVVDSVDQYHGGTLLSLLTSIFL